MAQFANPVKAGRTRLRLADLRRRWWVANYQALRIGVIKPARRVVWTDSYVEGTLPESRPMLLVPVHRTSIDIYAISFFVPNFISFVSTDSYGHNRIVNDIQKRLTSALGSVIWKQNGVGNRRKRALALARDVEARLEHRQIVVAFTQGEYQAHSVDSFEDGIVGLVRRFEEKQSLKNGDRVRIPVVPVGLEYELHNQGLVPSSFAERLARYLPMIPKWQIPALRSTVTVRFGKPRYFDDMCTAELTRDAMQEAAVLSRIPYNGVDG